ncbi:MAG: hypothetical protein NVS4B1_30460 [Ktedonobacteraceae bacterium]
MVKAPLPENESQRVASLHSLQILDTLSEERFERITRIAQRLFDVPITSITLVDANRQWFKSCLGLTMPETSRDISFCAHAILNDDVLVIPDAKNDPRFTDNPLVTGEPYIRFYAGQPLRDPNGYKLGTLCIIDRRPRQMSGADLKALKDLAYWAENELNTIELSQALNMQRKAEEAIQKSEARFRAIYQEAAIGIALVAMDGRLLESNPAMQEMLGYSGEELQGKVFTDITHPDDIAKDLNLYAELVAGKRSHYQMEKRYIRKDGNVVEGRLTVSIVRRVGSELQFAVGMVEDITERKRAEEELYKTVTQLDKQYHKAELARSESRAVLDAAGDAMILVSPERLFLSVNRRFGELFSINPDDILGHKFDDLQQEVERIFTDPVGFRGKIAGSATNAQLQFTEIISQCWPVARELELFSTPVRSANAEYIGRLYVFRDVTHEREVDRMKSEFVSLVSHELRTPLTSIKGYIDLLVDGDAGELNEEQLEYLGIAKNNADRLVALINDLLDVSRIESGKVELQRTVVDLVRLIQNAASSLRPQIDAKGQHLELDLSRTPHAVLADADRVTQILTNLLSNAYKYTPPGGTISVIAHGEENDRVRVEVKDTGIGLSSEEMGKLFTKFFRAKNRTTQAVGGTGLGLTITRSLVEMHGGEITVASVVGQGTTFSFTLPILQTTQKLPDLEIPLTSARPGGRILVVDDEPDIANLIRRYLEHASYEVLIAYNANDALSLARSMHPNLITLDIMLPDADGFTVLEWLKSDPETAAIPVVLLSMMDDAKRGKLLGAVDYLRKPVQERVLLERVGMVLAQDQAHLILVADDDDDVRSLIAKNLRRAGYQVVEATDGVQAIALAQSQAPALALLDIRMPGMDGIAVLRALRNEPATRNLAVIMMTASPGMSEESRSTVEALGGAMLLSKPCTAEELAEVIFQNFG